MRRRGRHPYPDILTPREWEVLQLLRVGLTNEEIADRLGISVAGVKFHVSEILSKTGVASRREAATWQPTAERRWAALPLVTSIAAPFKRWLGWVPGMVTGTVVAGCAVLLLAFAMLVLRSRISGGDAAGPAATIPASVAALPSTQTLVAAALATPAEIPSVVAPSGAETSPAPLATPSPLPTEAVESPYQFVIDGPGRAAPGGQVSYRITYTRVSSTHEDWGPGFVFMWDNTKASLVSSRVISGPTGTLSDQVPGLSIRWGFEGPGSGSVEVTLRIGANAESELEVRVYVPGTWIVLPSGSVDHFVTDVVASPAETPTPR